MKTQVDAVAARSAARADRRRADRVRGQRVTRLGFLPCHSCGGIRDDVDIALDDPDPAIEDPTLACLCAARRAQLLSRVERLAYERGSHRTGVRDRVAP